MNLLRDYQFVRTWSWKEQLFIGFVALGTASAVAYVVLTTCAILIRAIFGFGPHPLDLYHVTRVVK